MKKKQSFLWIMFLSLFFSVQAMGQSMADIVFSMPQEITPYLQQKTRKEMVELKLYGVSGDERNLFGGISLVDSVTNDYVRMKLSDALVLELKRLPGDKFDVLCMVKTYFSPVASSTISFFDMDWNMLDASLFLPEDLKTQDFARRPENMSETRYAELLKLIDFKFLNVNLLSDELAMTIELSVPYASKEEKKDLEAILLQKKLKYDGKKFN